MSKNNIPLISVIITTKNEENNIENCLKSILSQTYPKDKIEIIVVDNNSADKTKEIAKKYTKNIFNLEINSEIKNFRGAQINQGVRLSKGDIIFFPDADMTFSDNLLNEINIKIIKNDALYIPEIILGNGFLGKVRNFERSFYNETCIDGIRVIKKEVFKKIGGFDVKNIMFGPDDWDFTKSVKKVSKKITITKAKIFHNEKSLSLKTYLSKKSNYFYTFDPYIKKWGRKDTDIKKQFGIYYRYFGVFIENEKWKKIIKNPILFISVFFLRFLVGIKYLFKKS